MELGSGRMFLTGKAGVAPRGSRGKDHPFRWHSSLKADSQSLAHDLHTCQTAPYLLALEFKSMSTLQHEFITSKVGPHVNKNSEKREVRTRAA